MPSLCRKSPSACAWLPLAVMLAASVASGAPELVADHLILSEVVTIDANDPRRDIANSEFIEIVNPLGTAVDMSNVYLTDATYVDGDVGYWRIAETAPTAATAGGGAVSDFHGRFPTGYMLAAGDTIVVSIAGSNGYEAAYGRLPDFEVYEDGSVPDAVPELVEVFPGSINAGILAAGTNSPSLTDGAESVVLYTWDGMTDLVEDLDYVRWGNSTSGIVDKTGVTVGAGTYLADTAAAGQQTVSASILIIGQSYARVDADEGAEVTTGGNGATGHDETSENLATTWGIGNQDPALAPTTHHVTAPVFGAMTQDPAVPVDAQPAVVSLAVASETALTGVDFIYTVDGAPGGTLSGTETGMGTGIWTVTLPGQSEGTDVTWYATATNAAGATSTYPSAAPRFAEAWSVIAVPPPVISTVGILPPEPYDGQEVVISVTATSISPLTGAVFHVSYDGGAYGTVTGVGQGEGVFSATLPAQSEGVVVTWYVVVSNEAGLDAMHPADAPTTTEGWTVDEAPDPNAFPAKLLLTEICTLGNDQEFVEITNPGDEDVDMSDFYLTDAIYSTYRQYYWRIAEGNPAQNTIGGGGYYDFHARFPDGYMLAAGDTIVVSIAGSTAFAGAFGFLPDLELYEDDAFPDAVTDMRWVFGDEVNNSIINRTGTNPSEPTLTNTGEVIVLYSWHEGDDFVVDIDIFHWTDPTSSTTSFFFSKTHEVVGSHAYLPDTPVPDPGEVSQTPYPLAAAFGESYRRVAEAGEGNQILTGSNGVMGRDETSEDFPNTFALMESDPARPGGGGGGGAGGGVIELVVEAKTFLPSRGERFPIRFTSKPQSETRLRLFDLEGRLVLTLFDSRFNGQPSTIPGAYTTAVWDGLDEMYQRVRGGVYVVHLSVVDNETGEEETKTAPVVLATRLSN